MHGYCRVFDITFNKCKLGYHKNNLPNGKFQSFKSSGEVIEEGIKIGDNFSKVSIDTFATKLHQLNTTKENDTKPEDGPEEGKE